MSEAVYLMNKPQHLDKQLMEKCCLKGVNTQKGFLRIHPKSIHASPSGG